MAYNLINSNDIEVNQTENNIQLTTTVDMQTVEAQSNTNASDITDIKNGNVYSTNEVDTGKKWIDNKPIYRKVIDFGSLPNNTAKSVNHDITNISKIIHQEAIAMDSGGTTYSIPHVGATNMANGMTMAMRSTLTFVQVYCSANMTSYNAYFVLEYTKTTD